MTLDDVAKAVCGLPASQDLWVHPETYREIVNLFPPHQVDLNTTRSAASGLMGSFLGVNIRVSNLVPKGQVLGLKQEEGIWIPPELRIPPENPKPKPSPFDSVESLVEVGDDQWEARNANGQLLMELTERGARELAEERGIPLLR